MEPTPVKIPPMDEATVARRAIEKLCGVSGTPRKRGTLSNGTLTETQIGQIADRVYRARVAARMSAPDLVSMDAGAVKAFATRFKLTRAELRLAISLIAFNHSCRRVYVLGGFIGAERQRKRAQH